MSQGQCVAPRDSRLAPPDSLDTDEALVDRAQQGDAAAFEDLLRRYSPRLLRFVRWMIADDGAEDVVQEVLFEAYRSVPRFRGESSFRTWLFALARHVCQYHARRTQHRRREQPLHDLPEEQFVARALDPLTVLTREEQFLRVRRAVARLAPPLRTVLLLRDWEELSYQEIADVLDVPIGTVRSRIHNARAQLFAALSRPEGDCRARRRRRLTRVPDAVHADALALPSRSRDAA